MKKNKLWSFCVGKKTFKLSLSQISEEIPGHYPYLYAVDMDMNPVRCEMTGSLPSAQSNFASVEASYTCDDDQSGTATVGFVSPDESYATLLISVDADTADVQTHILAFE